MKKLLISLLTLFGCTTLPTMPQQNIFSTNCAYKCEQINIDHLAIAETFLSPQCESLILVERKKAFCKELMQLNDNDALTQESLLAMLNDIQPTNSPSIQKMHISELLKEQKNSLIRKNLRLVIFYPHATIGDTPAEDYSTCALFGAILSAGLYNIDGISNIPFYMTTAFTLGFTAKLYLFYRTVRNNEAEMNKIDVIIKKIEAIGQAEIQ